MASRRDRRHLPIQGDGIDYRDDLSGPIKTVRVLRCDDPERVRYLKDDEVHEVSLAAWRQLARTWWLHPTMPQPDARSTADPDRPATRRAKAGPKGPGAAIAKRSPRAKE